MAVLSLPKAAWDWSGDWALSSINNANGKIRFETIMQDQIKIVDGMVQKRDALTNKAPLDDAEQVELGALIAVVGEHKDQFNNGS
jgi:hypothetical protein